MPAADGRLEQLESQMAELEAVEARVGATEGKLSLGHQVLTFLSAITRNG